MKSDLSNLLRYDFNTNFNTCDDQMRLLKNLQDDHRTMLMRLQKHCKMTIPNDNSSYEYYQEHVNYMHQLFMRNRSKWVATQDESVHAAIDLIESNFKAITQAHRIIFRDSGHDFTPFNGIALR